MKKAKLILSEAIDKLLYAQRLEIAHEVEPYNDDIVLLNIIMGSVKGEDMKAMKDKEALIEQFKRADRQSMKDVFDMTLEECEAEE